MAFECGATWHTHLSSLKDFTRRHTAPSSKLIVPAPARPPSASTLSTRPLSMPLSRRTGSPTRSELYARAASQLVGICAAFFAAFARRSDSPHRVRHVRGARAASPSGRATANAQATPSESDERAPNGQANQTSTSQAFKPSERHVSSRASRDSVRGSTARRASTASRRRAQSEPVEKPRTRCRKRARRLCAWVTAVRMQNSL